MTKDDTLHPAIDPSRVRRLFERDRIAAADDFVRRETSRRMLDRLGAIRVEATRVLDIGCGSGADTGALSGRFAAADLHRVDLAMAGLRRLGADRPGGPMGWIRRRMASSGASAVQADFAALPFAAQTFDVLWSNLALHWSSAPHTVLREWSRVTRVGGLVAFSAFGPDTLREAAEAVQALGAGPHVVPFTDMHDYGDMLIEAGFATPVVDTERVTLTYSTPSSLWADVRALGGNPYPLEAGLRERRARERVDAALDATRDGAGRYVLTFELIFAHAWKGEPRRTRAGEAIVKIERRR